MDDRRPIGTTEEVFWEDSRKWGSMCLCLGIQDASRKLQEPYQEPGTWSGTVTQTTQGVYGLVSQDLWDNIKRSILDLVDMEDKEEGGLDGANMELIRGFLACVAITYRYMNPYLKGFYLTLYSWRPFRDNEGWIMHREQLKLVEMDIKWERVE